MIQIKKSLAVILTFLVFCPLLGNNTEYFPSDNDSIRVYNIEEDVVIIASPKENKSLRELPTSSTKLSKKIMQAHQIKSIKDLTGTVPNIFIPNYGSKLSSAIYIRGIGSRINTPSVGLYVDNIPFIDKSAFDFDFSAVERIDILRGPQSTLYGRNTMGGLIKVYTKSPFNYQGTDLKMGVATYGDAEVTLTHYHRVNNNFAFSTGAFYNHKGGFFKNKYLNNRMDKRDNGGGRFRGVLIPSSNLKLALTVNYEYSDEGGFPYGAYSKNSGIYQAPTNNREHSYRRSLFNTGLNLNYNALNFDVSAITGFQRLKDRMFIDQDFTSADIFTIMQKQQLNTFSEEVIIKSKPNRRWEWTTGLFGFIQNLRTHGPVWFYRDGITNLIDQGINKGITFGLNRVNSKIPPIKKGGNPFPIQPSIYAEYNTTNDELLIDGTFKTPIYSGAFYHQSTFNDLLIEGLSFTAGLRLNYEYNKLNYNSNSNINYNLNFGAEGTTENNTKIPFYNKIITLESNPTLKGKLHKSYLDLLPRVALQYNFNPKNSIYATVSRGYRSGGYNVQMFSDLIQTEMETIMKIDIKEDIIKNLYAEYLGLDDASKGKVQNMITEIKKQHPEIVELMNNSKTKSNINIKNSTVYKPEYTWNYEIGSHLNLMDNKFIADYSLFLLDTKNQQIAKFAESGLGRVTINAGKSRSYGAEAAMRYKINETIALHSAYGFTHAVFTEYKTNQKTQNKIEEVDYKGKRVPFVPRHTLNIGLDLNFKLPARMWLDHILINTTYSGIGKVYWTEENDVSQKFYATVNSNISLRKGKAYIDIWSKNLLNKDYATFYFESMGSGFMQRSNPIQFGCTVGCQF